MVHLGNKGAGTTGGTLTLTSTGSERVNQTCASKEPQEFRAAEGGGRRGSEHGEDYYNVARGEAGGRTSTPAEDSHDELSSARGIARSGAESGGDLRTLPTSERRRRTDRFVGGAEVAAARHRWRSFDFGGEGKGLPNGGIDRVGNAARLAEEGEQEQEDSTELSLDLSDCSDEVGRRRRVEQDTIAAVPHFSKKGVLDYCL